MSDALAEHASAIVVVNFALTAALLVVLARLVMRRPLQPRPGTWQNAAELAIEWFVALARNIHPARITLIAPFLATLFSLILVSNLLGFLPVPVLRVPPASYYSVPLALAIAAVVGVSVLSARINGARAALKESVWPNPLHLVSQASDTLSLSLRLYGNIGGEYVVTNLASQAAPYGVPLVIHALGLFPAVIQPIVFTLLTTSFLATVISPEPDAKRSAQ